MQSLCSKFHMILFRPQSYLLRTFILSTIIRSLLTNSFIFVSVKFFILYVSQHELNSHI